MERLRWQCRRGMLELDYLLGSFLEHSFTGLDPATKSLFLELLSESDQDLYQWLVTRGDPSRTEYGELLELIRNSAKGS